MSLVRLLARPLLAAAFIADGIDAVLHPMPRVQAAHDVPAAHTALRLFSAAARPARIPADPEFLVRAGGAAKIAAGSLLVIGRLPRFSSSLLAASLVPTALASTPYWREKDAERRRERRRETLLGLGLFGGALLGAVDRPARRASRR